MFFERSTAVDHDSLHLLVGTLVWVGCAIVTRRSLKSWVPLAVVVTIILINEAADLWVEIWPDKALQLSEGAKDFMITVALPLCLFVALRLFPWLGSDRRP